MGPFPGDLIRSFAVGFVLGTIGLVMVMSGGGEDASNAMVPQAIAAPAIPTAVN